jgi:hypothetical protein
VNHERIKAALKSGYGVLELQATAVTKLWNEEHGTLGVSLTAANSDNEILKRKLSDANNELSFRMAEAERGYQALKEAAALEAIGLQLRAEEAEKALAELSKPRRNLEVTALILSGLKEWPSQAHREYWVAVARRAGEHMGVEML